MNSCSYRSNKNGDSLASLIKEYIFTYRPSNQLDFDKIRSFKNLNDVIIYITLGLELNGKRCDHLRRFQLETLLTSKVKLLENIKLIKKSKDFHSLLDIITTLLLPIKGVGELFCYDTAFKLGLYLKLYPEYIYLHAGTRLGAQKLNLAIRKKYLTINEIPVELQILLPYEIEDFLCLYKKHF